MRLQISTGQNGSVTGKNGAVSPERRIVELSALKLPPERSMHQPASVPQNGTMPISQQGNREEPTFGHDAKLKSAENGKVTVNILGC
ncbi:MAG: hypothetical protein WC759_04175 [Candidatus Micrarchaeia archaeon]|jgi:hypothetical protein